jgi:CHRD domain
MPRMSRTGIGIAGAALTIGLLTACGGSPSSTGGTSATSTTSTGGYATGSVLTVALNHVPHGEARLAYDAASRSMTVTVHLFGLAPNSSHPAHIHAGSCMKQGPVVYPLNSLIADAKGVADATTKVSNVKEGGIPNGAWYVNVHNGPLLSPTDEFLPIVCGDVATSGTFAGTASAGATSSSVTVPLTSGPPPPSKPGSPDEAAAGRATLRIVDGALQVVLDLTELAPLGSHAAHIHLGSCEAQGPVFKPLNSVTADANGHATSTTTIPGITSIPSKVWYINVHRTVNIGAGQADFDPILCGNIGGQTGL